MKDELRPYIKEWRSFEDAKERISDWMDYYNNDRYVMPLFISSKFLLFPAN